MPTRSRTTWRSRSDGQYDCRVGWKVSGSGKLVAKGVSHLQVPRKPDEGVVPYSQRVHRLRQAVDLLSMNGNVFRGIEPKTYLVATYLNNRDDDVVTDDPAIRSQLPPEMGNCADLNCRRSDCTGWGEFTCTRKRRPRLFFSENGANRRLQVDGTTSNALPPSIIASHLGAT